jgi:hypothetical protein
MARLACTKPGARPEVGPQWALRLIASRAAWPVGSTPGFSRPIVAIAIARSASLPKLFAHFTIARLRMNMAAATKLRACRRGDPLADRAKSVETTLKIAFADDNS